MLVNVANWTDSNPPKLEVHEPEVTNTTVALGTDGQGSYGQGSITLATDPP